MFHACCQEHPDNLRGNTKFRKAVMAEWCALLALDEAPPTCLPVCLTPPVSSLCLRKITDWLMCHTHLVWPHTAGAEGESLSSGAEGESLYTTLRRIMSCAYPGQAWY